MQKILSAITTVSFPTSAVGGLATAALKFMNIGSMTAGFYFTPGGRK